MAKNKAALLRVCDVWTPIGGAYKDVRLARTITIIQLDEEGELIGYVSHWDIDRGIYDDRFCSGPTFRQWISKMRAKAAVDTEMLEAMQNV